MALRQGNASKWNASRRFWKRVDLVIGKYLTIVILADDIVKVFRTLTRTMEGDDPFEKARTVDPEVRAYVHSLVNAVRTVFNAQISANM